MKKSYLLILAFLFSTYSSSQTTYSGPASINYKLTVNTLVAIKLYNIISKDFSNPISEEQPAGFHNKAVNFPETRELIFMK